MTHVDQVMQRLYALARPDQLQGMAGKAIGSATSSRPVGDRRSAGKSWRASA